MINNFIKFACVILVTLLLIISIKYIDSLRENENLVEELEQEHLKEKLNENARTFISELYKGTHIHWYTKDAIERFKQSNDVEEIKEEKTKFNKDIVIHVINTKFNKKTYSSEAVYEVLEKDDKGFIYSKSIVTTEITWVMENNNYKINDFKITLLDSKLSEFHMES